jgi:hypothetical protein
MTLTFLLQSASNWSWLYHLGTDRVENASPIIAVFSRFRGNMFAFWAVA